MQVFRLVFTGMPDRMIAFDSLPVEFTRTLKTREPAGLPRHWGRWLKENNSVDEKGNPIFYICDYIMTNNDREAWQNITHYVRRMVDTKFRLLDKIEDMAPKMAKDSRADLTLEPEDVPVIPINSGAEEEALVPAAAGPEPKRGRKSKEI